MLLQPPQCCYSHHSAATTTTVLLQPPQCCYHPVRCNQPPRQLQLQRLQPATSAAERASPTRHCGCDEPAPPATAAATSKPHPPQLVQRASPTRHSGCDEPAPPATAAATSQPHPPQRLQRASPTRHRICDEATSKPIKYSLNEKVNTSPCTE